MLSIKDGSFISFEDISGKLSAKETKWTSLEVRTLPTFLETLISKYDLRPVKLAGLSRNAPMTRKADRARSQRAKRMMVPREEGNIIPETLHSYPKNTRAWALAGVLRKGS